MSVLEISHDLKIAQHELVFTASRSSGPGGQNVNKVNTKVQLRFDVDRSPSLSDEQRETLLRELSSRMTKDGVLVMSASRERSQAANRHAVTERFVELVAAALTPAAERKPTRIPRRVHRKRIEGKRRRGAVKRNRSRYSSEDDT